jgi:hypothetical protein
VANGAADRCVETISSPRKLKKELVPRRSAKQFLPIPALDSQIAEDSVQMILHQIRPALLPVVELFYVNEQLLRDMPRYSIAPLQ